MNMHYAKKAAVCLLLLSLLSLAACGTETKTDGAATHEDPAQEEENGAKEENIAIALEEDPEDKKEIENVKNPSEQKAEEPPASEGTTFKSVLLGKSNFVCTDLENQSLNISEIKHAVTDDDSVTIGVTKFAWIDLDGDGEEETVLWLQMNGISDCGFEILHYQNGEVYGYTAPYRAFMNLKTDGTFLFSNGSADFGVGQMIFSGTAYRINGQVYSESEYDADKECMVRYYADEEACSEDAFHAAIDRQEQKMDVIWYDLSDDNINAVL
ncbi:MAG: hypothetical protein NC416_19365 [Eubacterium sp.]|nr:hypothetical protein [Eubacterium sp.]